MKIAPIKDGSKALSIKITFETYDEFKALLILGSTVCYCKPTETNTLPPSYYRKDVNNFREKLYAVLKGIESGEGF